MNIEEFRQKFPQYNEYDDTQLANALYKKHYSDKLEFGEFAKRIGYVPPEATAPKVAAPVAPPSDEAFPFLRQVADVPLKVGAGIVTGVRMVADAFGADSSVGQNLRGVEDYIADLYSAQSKKDSQEIGRIMKAAEDKGVLDQVIAGAKAFAVAPVDMLSNALGTAAPAIAAGLATTLGGAPVLAARAATLGIGSLMGSGTVKGAIYDATKSALKENTNLSDKEIEARAVAAQEYGGQNLDQILMGAGLGAVGARTGIEPMLARQLAKGITSSEAVKQAIKQSAIKDTAIAAERGVIKQGAITGGQEFLMEGAQGGQEQLAQNIALQREGFDVPTMRGVAGQGTLEGLAGLGMGAVTGGREAASAKRELAGEKAPGQTDEQQKISDEALKDTFTPAKDLARKAGKGFDQASADLLMPASDAAGKALIEGVTRPDVTDIPVVGETKTKKAERVKPEDVTPETIQKAQDYVAKIEAGGKPTQLEVNSLAKELGVKLPFEIKSNVAKLNIIKQHLAEQGAPNVAGLNIEAGGGSPDVASLAPATQTAAGSAGPQPGGMVSTRADAGPDLDRTKQQPTALITPVTQRIITDEYNAGATPAELVTKYGGTPEVAANIDAFIKSLPPQGTTDGATTSQAKQTTAQGQTTTTGTTVTPKTLANLSPDMQGEVKRRQDEIAKIENSGRDAATEKNQLNKFLAKLGVTGTLSAKRDIKKDFLDEGELPYAVESEEKSDIALAQERVQAYKESLTDEKGKPRTIPDYDISAEDQQLYNEMRDEINPQVRTANETRNELVAAYDAAKVAYDQAEAGQEEEAAFKALNEAEDALEKHGPAQRELPEYSKKFSADYKDVYFGNISAGPLVDGKRTFGSSKREHRKAAAALQEYLQKTGGSNKEKLTAEQRRAVNQYEEGRSDYSKIFGVEFPSWPKLTQEQKNIFLENLPTLAGAQQTVAFAKLAKQLNKDNSQLSEGEKREKQNTIDRQEEVRRKSEEQQERDRKTREAFERNKPFANSLPNSVIQMIMSGDLQGVLDYMSNVKLDSKSAPTKRIMKTVAQALAAMKLNTKIQIVESEKIEGDLAQYDPVKDVIYITREGLSSNTILHEIIHAGTVKVINEYLYGNKGSLSQLQLAGVRQLERIMEDTRGSLAENHPEAYKNLFEFVSYALTSAQLQQDLHDESVAGAGAERLLKGVYGKENTITETVGKILPESKSQWSKFKLAIARILKVRDEYLIKGKLDRTADTNYLMEISAAFEDILVKPTEPVYLPALPSKAPLTATDKVEPRGLDPNAKETALSEKENPTKRSHTLYKTLSTRQGWRTVAKNVQDRGYFSRSLFMKQDKAGNIERDKTKGATNWDEERDLSVGKAKNYVTAELQKPMDDMRATFQAYLKTSGYKFEQAMNLLQQIAEMRHEPERRHVNWVLGVPLSTKQDLVHNGKPISAAQRRIDILGDPRTGAEGLIHKVELTKAQQTALFQELEILAKAPKDGGHADPLGDTPRAESYEKIKKKYDAQGADAKGYSIEEDNYIYNALGLDKVDIDQRLKDYANIPIAERELIEQMFAQAKVISDATMKMDKIGNYWSTPVSNLVGMYNYQSYMPFKGISKTLVDDMSDLNSEVNGAEMQDTPHAADGRFTAADNPFLRLLNDAYRSAARAGRKDYTQAIKNAVEKGLIPGKIEDKIKFAERNVANLAKYKGANSTYLFHYNEDGSIDIIKINDLNVLRALRYSFRDASPMLEMANAVTGFFGATHTRFNYNFAPLNFVRDALTNAWNIGTSRQLGPAKSLAYIANISTQVAKNGLGKAMEVALLHEKGDPTSMRILEQRAKNDPYTRDLLEYLRFGGKTVYMEGFSLSSNLQALNKGLNQSRIVATYEGFTRLIDSWNNMFEFSSRAVAYSMYKQEALKKNIAGGMSNRRGPEDQMSPAEEAASTEAAAFVKNLANFEKVGEYGRELGAAYMFIRPSATGAVRAIEAVLPAFTTEKQERADLPPQIANDEAAVEEYMKNFRQERKNAQRMITALIGGGMFLWTMSMLMSPDDDWERNSTKSDNMQQWTRFARFHIPNEVSEQLGLGKDVVFQIPWGFGLGAFASIGAQICGIGFGNTTFKEGMGNIVSSILADSFLPLPISKIEVTESPMKWAVDSIMPTVFRPVVEYLMNTNGVGQAINSATTRRLGEAFTGGDRIPEVYKTLSKDMYRQSLGAIDMSPNTLYFFTNSYLDGIAKMFLELPYSLTDLAQGEKTFNPKTDVPLFGSFFGAKTNVDSREYGKMEIKIKEMSQRLTTLEADSPELYAEYISKNPLVPKIVDIYQERQGDLSALRQKATEIRNMKYLSPKDRDSLLKITIMEQNFLKHMMAEDFKAYGLED
jgi:hypothetical protein